MISDGKRQWVLLLVIRSDSCHAGCTCTGCEKLSAYIERHQCYCLNKGSFGKCERILNIDGGVATLFAFFAWGLKLNLVANVICTMYVNIQVISGIICSCDSRLERIFT